MSLDKDRLGNGMADAVIAIMGTTPVGADDAALRVLMKALADEIIIEIKTNMVGAGTTAVAGGSSAGTHPSTIPTGGFS